MTCGVTPYNIFSLLVELGKNWSPLAIISLSFVLMGLPMSCIPRTPIEQKIGEYILNSGVILAVITCVIILFSGGGRP